MTTFETVKELVKKHFGDRGFLEFHGLQKYYKEMGKDIEDRGLIEDVREAASSTVSQNENFVTMYTNSRRYVITLTVTSICNCYLDEYHTEDSNMDAT